MKIPADKLVHLKYSPALALLVFGVVLVAQHFGPGFAVAAGSLGIAAGMEYDQKLRKSGKPSPLDALAGAAAGIVGGLLYEAWRLLA